MREYHSKESRKKINQKDRKRRRDYREGKIQITVGHFYSVVCELFHITRPDPKGFLKRLNDFYGDPHQTYFPNMRTVFHEGLVNGLENFLYEEFGHSSINSEKYYIAIKEALGVPFNEEEYSLQTRERYVNYTSKEMHLRRQKPA